MDGVIKSDDSASGTDFTTTTHMTSPVEDDHIEDDSFRCAAACASVDVAPDADCSFKLQFEMAEDLRGDAVDELNGEY